MNVLDLFSGIGGFSLGLERAGMRTVAFCEIEDYPRRVLARHWPDVPIHRDIRELDGEQYRGTVDVVCGGFPCQPFSVAGKQRGQDDDRHLWPEMLRVIREVQPTWVIGENVIGLEGMGLKQCVSDLESNGFEVQVFDIPACGVGAPHRRHRLWIVANAEHHAGRWRAEQRQIGHRGSELYGADGPVTYANDARREQQWRKESTRTEYKAAECGIGWPTESPLCEPSDGFPQRVAALKALGNAVVPQIPEIIGRAIMETERG